jgi:DTW domain-containing protein YfiP
VFVGICECAALPRLETKTEIVVVMHRLEQYKSSNTARLAVRMLARGSLVVRTAPEPPTSTPGTFVLFPNAAAISLDEARARGLERLVVPDGTWPQAGRIARRDPLCVGLPSVRLETERRSHYALRKSRRPHALCTFEAIAEALRVLEGDATPDRMHEVFGRWVALGEIIRRGAHGQRDIQRELARLAIEHGG